MQRPAINDIDVEELADGYHEVVAVADVPTAVAVVAAVRLINELAAGDEDMLDYAAHLLV